MNHVGNNDIVMTFNKKSLAQADPVIMEILFIAPLAFRASQTRDHAKAYQNKEKIIYIFF